MFYVVAVLMLFLVGNGIVMLTAPAEWYYTVPGVTDTGPLNVHFARDIGLVYLISGIGLLWRLVDPLKAWPFVLAGALFLSLHATLHVMELLFSAHYVAFHMSDIFGIYLPAVLACWFARPNFYALPPFAKKLLSPVVGGQIGKFEQAFDYDGTYMHEMADASLESISRFSVLATFGDYREGIPKSAWYTAKLIGCLSEDCGPCTQLVVRMAEADGVDPHTLEAVVSDDEEKLDEQTALVVQYAKAVLAHDPQAYDSQQQIIERWGEPGLISLAFALTSGRTFPQIKYAMGHGKTCTKIQIADHETPAGNYRNLASA